MGPPSCLYHVMNGGVGAGESCRAETDQWETTELCTHAPLPFPDLPPRPSGGNMCPAISQIARMADCFLARENTTSLPPPPLNLLREREIYILKWEGESSSLIAGGYAGEGEEGACVFAPRRAQKGAPTPSVLPGEALHLGT